jgi:Ca2+-binding RTX toxin-like protein
VENVTGGSGNDTITGSAAANRLNGGVDPTPDANDGSTGNDTLNGAAGNDVLNGFDGNDNLFGSSGADTLNGALGSDVMDGGTGTGDTVSYAGRSVGVNVNQNVVGGDGQAGENDDVRPDVERVTGTANNDTLVGATGSGTILNGGAGNDTLNGGNGSFDTLNAGAGNDTVIDNGGRDNVVGGPGNDEFHTSDLARDFINCGTGVDDSVDRDKGLGTPVVFDARSATCE